MIKLFQKIGNLARALLVLTSLNQIMNVLLVCLAAFLVRTTIALSAKMDMLRMVVSALRLMMRKVSILRKVINKKIIHLKYQGKRMIPLAVKVNQ